VKLYGHPGLQELSREGIFKAVLLQVHESHRNLVGPGEMVCKKAGKKSLQWIF
jgi:hypothetical protein